MSDHSPQTGNPWNLAMTRFKIAITRQVTRCVGAFEGKVDVMATPEIVLDDDHRYVLRSNGWWATSDIKSELAASGISTGLNAGSVDRTAAVLSKVTGTFANIALTAAGGAAPEDENKVKADNADKVGKAVYCTEDVAEQVALLYPPVSEREPRRSRAVPLAQQVQQKTTALASATSALELARRQARFDKALRAAVVGALRTQANAQHDLEQVQAKLDTATAKTSHVETVYWPNRSGEVATGTPYRPSPALRKLWVNQSVKEDNFETEFAVYFALSEMNDGDRWSKPSMAGVADLSQGVPVRMARMGQLLACARSPCTGNAAAVEAAESELATLKKKRASGAVIEQAEIDLASLRQQSTPRMKAHVANILQMGQVYMVPVRGGIFRSQQAAVAMDGSGLPTSIQVAEKNSVMEELANAGSETSKQLAALPAQLRKARLDKTNARIDQSTADAELASVGPVNETAALAVQQALATARTDLATALASARNSDERASVLAQSQLLDARADLALAELRNGDALSTAGIKARVDLLSAQDALQLGSATSAVADQTSLLTVQTTLLNAQAAQARALTERRAAEAEANLL